MRILVTGGAGYIGSVLVPQLLLEGHSVRVLDNFMFGQQPLLDWCCDPDLEIVRGDVRDEITLERALDGVDFIIHLAAIVGAPLCERDPIAGSTTNVEAVYRLVHLREEGQKIIYPCTNSGYGVGEVDEEGKPVYCTEKTPLRPVSRYGRQKVLAEGLLLSAGDVISLRLATVFGASPRMRWDLLVNEFVRRAVKDGYVILYQADFMRNYVSIWDVAGAFLHSIRNWDRMKNEVYNVGLSSANISKRELCEEIKKQVPNFYFHEAPIGEDTDKRNYIVSNDKMEATGWKAEIGLQDGITELIKACQVCE